MVLACLAGCGGDDGSTNGPLQGADVSKVGVPQTAGKPFVFGLPIAFNTGAESVVLERIGVENTPAGLEVMETYVIGPERAFAQAYEFAWPSTTGHYKGIKPVRGYELAPGTQGRARLGVQLVYVMRAKAPGEYTFPAVTVDYRVGADEHRARVENGLIACVFPEGEKPDLDRCDAWRKERGET